MKLDFVTANRILFGTGKSRQIGILAREIGSCALVMSGTHLLVDALEASLKENGIQYQTVHIHGEPTVPGIIELMEKTRSFQYDLVIGIGGGSVLDAAKALAAMRTNPGDLMDYLEIVGAGKPLLLPAAPYIAVPTTAGTGSEVTRNAVLGVPAEGVKVSLRSPLMLPTIALVDPELTLSVPPEVTASTGMDALTQVIEPYLSNKANPMVDLFCREGITRVRTSLRKAYLDGGDIHARTDMAWASLLGGMALANAGLGAVHGFAGPIGGMFNAPHGAICARLLPIVFGANAKVIAAQSSDSVQLDRFKEVARILCDCPSASISDGVGWLYDIVRELAIPSLSYYGVREEDIPLITEKAKNSSSMKANPVQLPSEVLREILAKAL
ncbi:MAG: iron-containing alcohol dehydrogenase [Anaerolineaceae bacterium]|nr:iron-containing alcohol dehydrogenase [Anaerolineaceae bacterium]